MISAATGLAAWLASPLLRAAGLVFTPAQDRGPFYPLTLPLDKDNDLTRVAGQTGVASGEITDVSGHVLDASGRPLRDVLIEIWQVNAFGRYHHEGDRQDKPLDPNFQGYGQCVSDAQGAYRFRTIKPVAYPGRAPHIHFSLRGVDARPLTTQLYVAGAPENEKDFLLRGVRDPALRRRLIVPFEQVAGAEHLTATFDLVLETGAPFTRG
jgi:protocatechuate 3,4-dioxygenase, beta subunit